MAEKKRRLQFLNSFYYNQERDDSFKVVQKDRIEIVFRDLETGDKKIMKQEEPRITFFQLKGEKEEEYSDYYRDYVSLNDVFPVRVKYTEMFDYMINEVAGGNKKKRHELMSLKQRQKKSLHQSGLFYSSDIDIQDYYKGVFLDKYDSEGFYLNKGYFDIEVDIKGHVGFPDQKEA